MVEIWIVPGSGILDLNRVISLLYIQLQHCAINLLNEQSNVKGISVVKVRAV